MKRMIISAFFAVLLVGCFAGCDAIDDRQRGIPSGYTKKEEFFDKEGFQDYTDYCKYYYDGKETFENDSKYTLYFFDTESHVLYYVHQNI